MEVRTFDIRKVSSSVRAAKWFHHRQRSDLCIHFVKHSEVKYNMYAYWKGEKLVCKCILLCLLYVLTPT